MEFVSNVFNWVYDNYGTIATVVASLNVPALAIVNLTKTPKDDAIYAKLYKVIMFLGGLWTKEAQGLRENGTLKR